MGTNEDERFSHIATDPKFRRIPKVARKVKIDNRFKSMFKDKSFKVKYTVDKRGRPMKHSSKEDLKRYYKLGSGSSSEESDIENEIAKSSNGRFVKAPTTEIDDDKIQEEDVDSNELNKTQKHDRTVTDKVRKKLKDLNVDYARGEGVLMSDSSSDDDDAGEDVLTDTEDVVEHKWGELDADADRTDEITNRLAVCNMDWDRIRATDLMVLFNSFLPPGGLIHSINIYPSEYGLERMKEEEVKGPIELVEHSKRNSDKTDSNVKKDDEKNLEDEEGSKFHMEKLRQYQLNRLKYYYGVLTCDSLETANKIYTECDGLEYESTATKIDLRFIPDDMTFDTMPKDVCEKLPDLDKYKPIFFTTTCLQQAKVNLTWDETNPERLEIADKMKKGKISDLTAVDLQNYLASSSDEDVEDGKNRTEVSAVNDNKLEEDDDNPIAKYKSILQEIEEKEQSKKKRDVEMEISWGISLKDKTDKIIKEKIAESEKEHKTPFQLYLDKKKEKRKAKKLERLNEIQNEEEEYNDVPSDIDMNDPYFAEEFDSKEFGSIKSVSKRKNEKNKTEISAEEKTKQAELELLLEEDDGKKHFNFKNLVQSEGLLNNKPKKQKNKVVKTEEYDDFEVNVADERFSAIFTSHHYNIDPTDPHYKKSKGMLKLVGEKMKRRVEEDTNDNSKKPKLENQITKNAELNVLVKSIKRKTHEAFTNKKK